MPAIAMPKRTKFSASSATDEELLVRYRDLHDLDAFSALMHRYDRSVFEYLLHYLRSQELAEEVFQATFFRIHEKCGIFDPARRFRPWLYNIAAHLAADAYRKERRHKAVSLDQRCGENDGHNGALRDLVISRVPTPPEQLEAQERAEKVWNAMDCLPAELRSLALLVYSQGLTFQEAAEALHLPLGTVKSRLHRALEMVRNGCRSE